MKSKQWAKVVIFFALLILCPFGAAQAATGTLKGTFVYKDPSTGIEQLLSYGFIYLHSASNPPPMEKFSSKADSILGPTSKGVFSLSIPAGSYYIRILQRKVVLGGATRPYGPPEAGDYTWMQQLPITITAGATLDLGKKYAVPYASSPITITGTIKSAVGSPLQGRYVRAQTEPCLEPINCNGSVCEQYGNQCGPVKLLAMSPTAADGSYTLFIADSGTYYIYTSTCLMPGHNQYDGTRCEYTSAAQPVTVSRGDKITVDIVAN